MAKGSQLSRQWQLLRILENFHYGVSVEELAEKVEYCRRTVERDLDDLQRLGFPIAFETEDYGKKLWRLERIF